MSVQPSKELRPLDICVVQMSLVKPSVNMLTLYNVWHVMLEKLLSKCKRKLICYYTL